MPKDIRTNLVVGYEDKGLSKGRKELGRYNQEVVKGAKEQARSFSDAEKRSASFDKTLDGLRKKLTGTTADVKKQVETVAKGFDQLNKADFSDVQKHSEKLKGGLEDLYKQQMAVSGAMSEMGDTGSAAYSQLEDQLKDLDKETRDAERNIKYLERAFSSQAKAAKKAQEEEAQAYKKAKDVEAAAIKKVQREQAALSKQEADAARARKGAFVQGLAQGGLPFPAPFLQRGPGMGRQVAGMGIGRGIMGGVGGARAMGGAAYGGAAGLAQGLSAIPGIGGFLSGQIQTAAQAAQSHRQWQQTRLGGTAYTYEAGQLEQIKSTRSALSPEVAKLKRMKSGMTARQAERAAARDKKLAARAGTAEESGLANLAAKSPGGARAAAALDAQTTKARALIVQTIARKEGISEEAAMTKHMARKRRKTETSQLTKAYTPSKVDITGYTEDAAERLAEAGIRVGESATLKAQRKIVSQKAGAVRRARGGGMEDIGGLGAGIMGVSKPEAFQRAMGVIQAGGGRAREARQQGIVREAFAAQTMYGVGQQTSGAFLQAGRRGGMVGAQGKAGDTFVSAIEEGFRLGLTGSETNQYLDRMAQGIQQFQSTGIPINKESLSTMATEIGGTGVTGTRAVEIAGGLQKYLQGMGQRGITGGMDLLALQMMGGYKGGGAKEYRAAMGRMEEMRPGLQNMDVTTMNTRGGSSQIKFLKELMRRGGGDVSQQTGFMQKALSQMGVQMSIREADYLGKQLSGEAPDAEQAAAIRRERARRSAGAAEAAGLSAIDPTTGRSGSEKRARGMVSAMAPSVKSQAQIENQRIALGGKVVHAMDTMEKTTMKVNKGFTDLASGPIKDLSKGLSDAVTDMSTFVTKIREGADAWSLIADMITGL